MASTQPNETVGDYLARQGVSRRAFMKYCIATASMMGLAPSAAAQMADKLAKAKRPSVIYLSFQECTGCLESLTRSFSPTLESLIFNSISLDYQHTLMAASGDAAEAARHQTMERARGEYIVIVDGSVPDAHGPGYCTIAGHSAKDILDETVADAAAVISVGTCAAFGGIPYAHPNPTGAVPIYELVRDKPIINVSGCPPIPSVITGTLAHYLTLGEPPELDENLRPKVFFGNTIHDRCYRRPFYDQGKFAKSFDDEGARNGWCLYELGCKGPTTYNACATVKWNGGVSFPIESGHGCIGCSEPNFWDKGDGFYVPQSAGVWGSGGKFGAAAAAGVALGAGAAALSRYRQNKRLAEQSEEG